MFAVKSIDTSTLKMVHYSNRSSEQYSELTLVGRCINNLKVKDVYYLSISEWNYLTMSDYIGNDLSGCQISKCVLCLSLSPYYNAMTKSKLNSLSYLYTKKSCRSLDHKRQTKHNIDHVSLCIDHASIFREQNVEEFVAGGYPAVPDQ